MRRRNKPRVVWIPQDTTFSVGGRSTWQFVSTAIDTSTVGNVGILETAVLIDGQASDPLDPSASLSDIENSGYRLRRIVGKIYCFLSQGTSTVPSASLIGVTAGFIVRRINTATGGSLAAATGLTSQIDPADVDNTMDPWIWRRSWLLGSTDFQAVLPTVPANDPFRAAPGQNYANQYPGGNAEGPHIDQKTARIIGPEERLFLDVSATVILNGGQNPTSLIVIYETRVLGSMRTSSGNRRNASR